ncbi:MAG: hypothetical protein KA764_11120, partial [Anaerolineales bacterium]|nr:hypothetical protein [Anaerolineales bacterium]
ANLALIAALAMAGLAQWWMARTFGLGRVARLWSADLAVAGGHLFGRMHTGQFGMVLSLAACSLTLAAALQLAVTGRRRSAVGLALTLGLALVAGQGYAQLSLLSWSPAFLVLILDRDLRLRPAWREFALAVGLAGLLAGVFLVPALRFLPSFDKPGDADFGAAQLLEYLPLNLVIRDWSFLLTETLDKLPFPELYTLYIGWLPVLLAPLVLRYARREHIPALAWLGLGMMMSFVIASGDLIRWLTGFFPVLAGFRHAPLMAGLAVPALLGLAAYGLDGLLRQDWPRLNLIGRPNGVVLIGISLAWVLAPPLAGSLWSALEFSGQFLATDNLRAIYDLLGQVRTRGVEWVAPPFGDHFWIEPGLYYGLKLSPVVYPALWLGRGQPEPQLLLSRDTQATNLDQVGLLGDMPVYRLRDSAYAYVVSGPRTFPCLAAGRDGDLDITCHTNEPGQLFVQENAWEGWSVTVDGRPTGLQPAAWLSVSAPAGEHRYSFRYRPWDVWAGLALTLTGLGMCGWFWRRAEVQREPRSPSQGPQTSGD